jgi:hypothetical protein
MHLSDKDRRRERYNRKKRGGKQRKRKQERKHDRQLDREDWYAEKARGDHD